MEKNTHPLTDVTYLRFPLKPPPPLLLPLPMLLAGLSMVQTGAETEPSMLVLTDDSSALTSSSSSSAPAAAVPCMRKRVIACKCQWTMSRHSSSGRQRRPAINQRACDVLLVLGLCPTYLKGEISHPTAQCLFLLLLSLILLLLLLARAAAANPAPPPPLRTRLRLRLLLLLLLRLLLR